MPEITARVYSGDAPATLIAALDDRIAPQWLDELNDTGSGSVQVHVDDPVLASNPGILDYDNIVRFALDGVDRFAFIIEPDDDPLAPASEKAGRLRKVSGRGVLALLEAAIVYPEAQVEGSLARQRPFDWTAIVYDDATWVTATQLYLVDASPYAYAFFPSEWPDPLAYWIWSRANSALPNPQPVGTCYFRKEFTLASAKTVGIFASADDTFRVWLDGEVVFENLSNTGTTHHETLRADKMLAAGSHQLAVEAVNLDLPNYYAGIILSIFELTAEGQPGTNIVRTNNTWLALDYPTDVPGMTPGEILRILVEEAQTRGTLDGVTLDFDDDLDSNGNAWSSEPDIALDIGTDLLNVILTFVEQFVDVEMTPTYELKVYNKLGLGADLTGSVNLEVGEDFEELNSAGAGALTNAILARDTIGELTQREDTASLAVRKRKETYLELALAPNMTRAQAMCDEVFTEHGHPVRHVSGRVTKASGPYTVYTRGDTILMPSPAGAEPTTVLSLAFEEDAAGHPIIHVEGAQDQDASS